MKNKLFLCFIIMIFTSCFLSSQEKQNISSRGGFSEELSISELEAIISEAEEKGNVAARSHIHQYW